MKKILIIGGTSGVGLATVKRFSQDHKVIFTGRNSDKGHQVDKNFGEFIQNNISKLSDRMDLLEIAKLEKVEKVVHCAGIFSENHDSRYEKEYREVKMSGVSFIKALLKQSEITHVCAISSLYTFLPTTIVPAFEKSVQVNLENKVFSLPKKVIVNCVAPGLTNTPLIQRVYTKEHRQNLLSLAPRSRMVEPEEVAETIYWLMNQERVDRVVVPVDGNFLRYFQG